MYYSEIINRIDDKLRAVVQYNADGTYEIQWDDEGYKEIHGVDQVHPSVADIEAMHTTVKQKWMHLHIRENGEKNILLLKM